MTTLETLATNATQSQREEPKEKKKKDYKTLFLIYQCLDRSIFERVSNAVIAKSAWDNLSSAFSCTYKLDKARLKTLGRHYENLQMQKKALHNYS